MFGIKSVACWRTLYAIVIFLGACSGVVFGNVTLSTPFSIDALISSA